MLILALLLGLRHATDPDHLTAVATLVLDGDRGARRAGALGLAWGIGHATSLFGLALPFVLVGAALPDPARRIVEAAIGILIVTLAVRILVRWRRGVFHSHPHMHGGRVHTHPHVHRETVDHDAGADHNHRHATALGRSPMGAFGVGLLHGVGGSAAAGVLVVAAAPGIEAALAALAFFASATAISMAATSFLFALVVAPTARRIEPLIPLFGLGAFAFGIVHTVGALL